MIDEGPLIHFCLSTSALVTLFELPLLFVTLTDIIPLPAQLLDLLIELQAREEEEVTLNMCGEGDAESGVAMDGEGEVCMWGSPPRHRQRPTRTQCSPCIGEGALNVNEHGTCVANSSSSSSSSRMTGGKTFASAAASVSIDDTPRKMRRMQAMKNARFNQTGQLVLTYSSLLGNLHPFLTTHSVNFFCSFCHLLERNKSVMTVQKSWTEQSHQFISDRDLLGPMANTTSPSPSKPRHASSREDA